MKKLQANVSRILLNLLQPVIKYLGSLHMPFSHKKITGKEVSEIISLLKPGQVILAQTRGELSNLLISGFWKHAAIVLDSNTIIEAVGKGVIKKDIITFLMAKDHILVLEPTFTDENSMIIAANWCLLQVGSPYDYDFRSKNKAYYCAELPADAYNAIVPNCPFKPRSVWGTERYTPQQYAEATSKWKQIWNSEGLPK